MKRILILLLGSVILLSGATACGSSSKSIQSPAAAQASASASSSTGTCAEAGTRKIPKTRLLADLGLTYGAFHRYPVTSRMRPGPSARGQTGRTKALLKAGLAVRGGSSSCSATPARTPPPTPTLCKYVPNIDSIKAGLSGLADKIKGGTASSGNVSNLSRPIQSAEDGAGFTSSDSHSSLPGLG